MRSSPKNYSTPQRANRHEANMFKVNIIAVYDQSEQNLLMCFRSKDPYKGLYNLVGGKVEDGEEGLLGAYRELREETGIKRTDIKLAHLMDFEYHVDGVELQVYVGRLNKDVNLVEEKHTLHWIPVTENLFSMKKFAGEGNIGHIHEVVTKYHDKLIA